MKRLWILSLTIAVAACHHPPPDEGTAPLAARAVRSAVASRAAAGESTAPAQVYARDRASLSARTPASVVALPVREGERVTAGTVVLRLQDAAANAAVAAAQAARDAAEAERRRTATLLDHGAATPREMETVSARAAEAEAALHAAQDNLAYAILRAPFDGVVTALKVSVGDVIVPGQPLLEMEGARAFEVRAFVDGGQAARLARGESLAVDVDHVRQPLAARITALSPAGDPTSHRFELRADLENASGLRSGAFARVHLHGDAAETAVSVPRAALVLRGGLQGLFVVAGGKASLRWVAVGAESGERLEIRAGLAEGERVALSPTGLEDGTPVVEED